MFHRCRRPIPVLTKEQIKALNLTEVKCEKFVVEHFEPKPMEFPQFALIYLDYKFEDR